MIIAVDFDGTLVENHYPLIGEPLTGFSKHHTLIEDLITLQQQGHKLILWTCRGAQLLEDAVNFCKSHGLEFDAVNDDLSNKGWEEELEVWRKSGKARKIFADIYLDDRALNVSNKHMLRRLL